MPRVISSLSKIATTGTTFTMPLTANVEDDLVLCFIAQDGLATTAFTVSAGWTIYDQDYDTGNGRLCVFYKVAGSGGETTAPVVTGTVTGGWTGQTATVRGVDTADIFEAASSGTSGKFSYDTTGDTTTALTCTPTNNDCLVFSVMSNYRDTRPQTMEFEPDTGIVILDSLQTRDVSTASCNLMVAWEWQATGGVASTTQTAYSYNVKKAHYFTFALNDDGNGHIPAHIDPATNPCTLLEHIMYSRFAKGGAVANATTVAADINGTTVNNNSILGLLNQFYQGYGDTHGANYMNVNNPTLAASAAIQFGSTHDFTAESGLLMLWIKSYSQPDSLDVNNYDTGGLGIVVYDNAATEEWTAWKVAATDTARTSREHLPVVIQVDNAQGTEYDFDNTLDTSSVKGVFLFEEKSTAQNYVGYHHITSLNKLQVAGGSTSFPVDINGLYTLLSHWITPYAELLGKNAILSYIPIQIGGDAEVNIALDGMNLQFPESFNEDTLAVNVHVDDNTIGLTLDGNSGDTISITNSLISGASKWHFIMASGLAGTYDLSGTTISNAGTVTLRDISQDLDGMTFSECDTIALNGCDLTNTTITKSTADVALDITSVAECADLANLTFTDNNQSATAHSIELTGAAGTYDFDNFTFSGGGADASNTADVYNNTGGAVTITVTNGGDTPTYKNGAGASTTISNAVTVTVTALDEAGSPIENARVLLEETGGTDILTGLTNASGVATTSYEGTYPQTVQGWVRKGSASTYYKQAVLAGSVTSSGYDVTVTMVADE